MRRKNYDVRCIECGELLLRYVKYGKGNLVNCYKDRIIEDNSVKKDGDVRCECGNVIGIDRPHRIKMKSHAVDLE